MSEGYTGQVKLAIRNWMEPISVAEIRFVSFKADITFHYFVFTFSRAKYKFDDIRADFELQPYSDLELA